MSVPIFKDLQLKKCLLKKSNSSIFNALILSFSIKTYYLRLLKSSLKTLVSISLKHNCCLL